MLFVRSKYRSLPVYQMILIPRSCFYIICNRKKSKMISLYIEIYERHRPLSVDVLSVRKFLLNGKLQNTFLVDATSLLSSVLRCFCYNRLVCIYYIFYSEKLNTIIEHCKKRLMREIILTWIFLFLFFQIKISMFIELFFTIRTITIHLLKLRISPANHRNERIFLFHSFQNFISYQRRFTINGVRACR